MNTWNEYGRWVDKEDLDGLAKSKDELVRMAKSKGLNIVRWGKDETNGNNVRPVLEVKDKKIMNDSRAKIKSFLAQEFRDLKARLSKKAFKDSKPKSQREVWLTGLSSIKDSLQRFKDKSEFYRNNGYRIQITELNDYIEYIVFDPKGAYRALKKESGFSSAREALKAAEAYTNSLPHSDRWRDSAINDEQQGSVIKTVKYGSFNINITVDKDGSYGFVMRHGYNVVAVKKNLGSEQNAIDVAKSTANSFSSLYDSAEYINDRKIDIKKDGKLIDTVNAESLDEAVRIYERQHPELRGQIDAYFSDGKVEDGFEEEWSKLMFKMKRLQMNQNTKWSEMEALNEEMNALKKKYGKNN